VQDLRAIRFIEGTKISHDYIDDQVTTFSYRELIERRNPAVGIPCRQNKLLVVDVDVAGPTHKKDGREFWTNFVNQYSIPLTYTVRTPSGGYHFYFRLPESINPDTFSPPGELSSGVDLKWNGWVGAPPTAGYDIHYGNVSSIQYTPEALLEYLSGLVKGKPKKTFDVLDPHAALELHRPFSQAQLHELRTKIEWMQVNASLSRQEWRDGLFALKAGVDDPVLLDELACRWSMNKNYTPGDEEQARSIIDRAAKHGPIGPGTIFSIIREVQIREGAPCVETPFTTQEIFDRAKIQMDFTKEGKIKIEPSESNCAALLGAIFDEKTLYHDIRTDLYIYKGKSYSDSALVNMFLPILQSSAYGLGLDKFRKQCVAGGLDVLMAKRQKDPHVEYLKSLKWDGVKRIDNFFTHYAGVEDSEYVRIVSKNFWVSLAARGLQPGCKFDSMVVLEGREGISKSSFVEAIGGDYTFAPTKKDSLDNIDVLRQMHQSVIVELPELVGLITETSEKVKGFLALSFDHIRGLFARKAMRNNRGFVFVGTTNSERYLALAMGARRFWPIRIPDDKRMNIAGVRSDRDMLFAEAVACYKDGYEFWNMPKGLLDPVISKRVISEPLIEAIKDMIPTLGTSWTTIEVYRRLEAQGFVSRGLNSNVVNRIEDALQRIRCDRSPKGFWYSKKDSFGAFTNQAPVSVDSFI